jgi:hypothetical protein
LCFECWFWLLVLELGCVCKQPADRNP